MRACIALSQRVKAKYVVIRLGERGTFLFDGKFSTFVSAYDVPQPKGVESDDAFGAALVHEYLRSDGDIARACDFATVVSAVYLARGGGLRAYPYFEDVRRFVKKNEIDYDVDEL
jgi:ribokinase